MMKYPNPCCRCGFCCLSETCPVGMEFFGIEKYDRCPALEFEDDIAECRLSHAIPIGDGCCIKARAYRNGVEYDFALLPAELKRGAAQDKRRQMAVLNTGKNKLPGLTTLEVSNENEPE